MKKNYTKELTIWVVTLYLPEKKEKNVKFNIIYFLFLKFNISITFNQIPKLNLCYKCFCYSIRTKIILS